jgi:BirA family biotin operon repressor/biotin-[acetyl-CoA-carboxylase] ligase
MKWRMHRFSLLPSTNDLALAWLREGLGQVGDVILAQEQTAGRGRRGTAWCSPRGSLLLTALLPAVPHRTGWVALAAGLAAARAARCCGAPAQVKWPNDVLVGERKLAGVLVESCGTELLAVGIGMNVAAAPLELATEARRAACLAEYRPAVTVEEAEDALLTELATGWEQLLADDVTPLRTAWAEVDATAGRRVLLETGERGTALRVDADGALILRVPGEEGGTRMLRVLAGAVHLLPGGPDGAPH